MKELENPLKTLLSEGSSVQLKQLDRLLSIGLLSAGMFHDLRTVLNGISAFADILKHSQAITSSKESLSDLEQIIESVSRGKQICERMLNYAKITSEPLIESSLHEVISQTVHWLSAGKLIQQTKIRLQLAHEPIVLFIQQEDLQQVLVNLILNAVQATGGNGDILISTQETMLRQKPYVNIYITDNGVGIAKEHIDQLFKPLFTTKQEGTGLGLYMTQRIIQEYKGRITVKSDKKNGTTFCITIPRKI